MFFIILLHYAKAFHDLAGKFRKNLSLSYCNSNSKLLRKIFCIALRNRIRLDWRLYLSVDSFLTQPFSGILLQARRSFNWQPSRLLREIA